MKTKKTAPHSALRSRIKTLGVRTVALKRQMLAAGASHRISRLAQAADLELRHKRLAAELHLLDLEGPGVLQDAKAALSLLADDYEGLLDSLMVSTEAHYAAGQNMSENIES
jgi:hypothetical protein